MLLQCSRRFVVGVLKNNTLQVLGRVDRKFGKRVKFGFEAGSAGADTLGNEFVVFDRVFDELPISGGCPSPKVEDRKEMVIARDTHATLYHNARHWPRPAAAQRQPRQQLAHSPQAR